MKNTAALINMPAITRMIFYNAFGSAWSLLFLFSSYRT
jgi:hypothetical protein